MRHIGRRFQLKTFSLHNNQLKCPIVHVFRTHQEVSLLSTMFAISSKTHKVAEKIHTWAPHMHGRSLEIPRGRGVLKVKILEAKYEAKLEYPGGMGGGGGQNKKTLPWGEYGYFLELHNVKWTRLWPVHPDRARLCWDQSAEYGRTG